MIGQSVAHYRVTAKLGEGGMGEVYRASDTKLGRDVALKLLPEAVAADPERMARFEREAQLLAALNHPNIAAIYGLEGAGGARCLVLELVEGETLGDRIARGRLPLEEALPIARQVAEALGAAHEKGIVHRDLKPGNIKITPDGTVKVLDFGLAKALASEVAGQDVSRSPTLTMAAATQHGVILGTAAYMSPEQARGRGVDKRADIWAFGCVLYEMLTGKQAYGGETITDTLAGILKSEVGWNALPAEVPHDIRRLLRRCLEKDPKRRLRDIGEAWLVLEDVMSGAASAEPVPAPAIPRSSPTWQRVLPWGLAGITTVALLVALASLWKPATPQAPLRLMVKVSSDAALDTDTGAAAILSPDGQTLAFVGIADGVRRLFVRPLSMLEATALSGTEGARAPFFSPDSQWLGFFTDNELKKVSLTGGAPLTLCVTQDNRGGTWGPDGSIVFASHITTGLSRIPAAGGTPKEITTLAEGERSHRWPHFLPGGKAVLFIAQSITGSYDDAKIEVLNLETGQRKVVHEGGTYPHYAGTGHLLYVRGGTIFARPFDLNRMEAYGSSVPVLHGIRSEGTIAGNGGAQYALSKNGTLAYLTGLAGRHPRSIVRADRTGATSPLLEEKRDYWEPRLSPRGDQLAFSVGASNGFDVWVYQLARGTLSRLTFQGAENFVPVWSPDGERIAFVSSRDGTYDLYWKRADGAGDTEQLTNNDNYQVPGSFSPDGKLLAYQEQSAGNSDDIWVLPLQGDRKPVLFLSTPASEQWPEFSPDGRWIAYSSNESGRYEVYVRPYPGPGGKWQISTNGGSYPRWAKNGRELIYREVRRWMAAGIEVEGDSLRADRPSMLFEGDFVQLDNPSYDASRDGRQFILLQAQETDAGERDRGHLMFVFNFFEELRRLAPADKN